MISIEQQIQAAERELSMRRRVYPRRVDDGKMTPEKSAHEIAAMEAIIETLKGLASALTKQPGLDL
jgi:hypothetical protein